MHQPISNLGWLGRRGFLGLAGVTALADSPLSHNRVAAALVAKDMLAQNTGSSAGSSRGLPPLKITTFG